MCNPIAAIATIAQGGAGVPAAMATLGQFASVASGTLGVASAITGANAQADAAEQSYESIAQAKVDTDRQLNIQEAQLDEKAAQEKINRDLEAKQIASRIQATDSGLTLNNNAVIQDVVRRGLVANNMTTQNLERNVAQIGEQRLGAKSTAQSRINAVVKPSRTATGLQIGTSVLGAASDYSKFA